MRCINDKVEVKPGRNVWLLARTDRDAPDRDDVIQTAAAVLKRFLGQASPLASRSIFEVVKSPKGEGRFIIGAARPVLVTAVQGGNRPEILGAELARFEDCSQMRSVKASSPWWVTAAFDWRGGDVLIDWPRRSVNFFGIASDSDNFDLDWLLIEARFAGSAGEPDTSLSGEVLDEAEEIVKEGAAAVGKALSTGLTLVLVGAGAALAIALAVKLANAKKAVAA